MCYTCYEQESLAQYISELETLNEKMAFTTIPLMRNKIEYLSFDIFDLKADKKILKQEISLLKENETSFKKIEHSYLSEIADLNMKRTNLEIKRKKKNKIIGIVAGVGGGIIAALVVSIVVIAK